MIRQRGDVFGIRRHSAAAATPATPIRPQSASTLSSYAPSTDAVTSRLCLTSGFAVLPPNNARYGRVEPESCANAAAVAATPS